MKCSVEVLQAFLDGELNPLEIKEIRQHLVRCQVCRQEMSRLRLLWLELEKDEEMEAPPELPYIRQQAVARASAARRQEEEPGSTLWDARKLAWQPALAGMAQIPGTTQLGMLARTTIRSLPAVIRGVSSMAGLINGKRRDRR